MKKTVLQNYARLIARKGVNVQKGQDVVIRADLDQPEFVKMVAEECYKAGARLVSVDWSYQPMAKVTYRHCKTSVLSKVEEWSLKKLEHRADTLPAMIYLESEDPDGLKGINQKKVAEVQQKQYPIIKPIRDRMENKYQWCIAAVPGEKWAKKVFPNLRKSAAIEKLWEMILYTSRADGADPSPLGTSTTQISPPAANISTVFTQPSSAITPQTVLISRSDLSPKLSLRAARKEQSAARSTTRTSPQKKSIPPR